jgi:hypothetical protein
MNAMTTLVRSNVADTTAQSRYASIISAPEIDDLPTEDGFAALRSAFQESGGTVRERELLWLLEDFQRGFETPARLLLKQEIFGFAWDGQLWIPMFQFHLADMSVRLGPQRVRAALGANFKDWRLAAWFARPHSALEDQRPVDLLGPDLSAVLEAARADSFAADD